MPTPLTDQANAVLSALQEGMVTAVVRLYEVDILGKDPAKSKKENIKNYLTHGEKGLCMLDQDADYWLDWFGINE